MLVMSFGFKMVTGQDISGDAWQDFGFKMVMKWKLSRYVGWVWS